MTTDDILRMAREAGALPERDETFGKVYEMEVNHLERFASIATAHEREARQAAQRQVAELQERLNRADAERCSAVLAEREECAKVCEAISTDKWALYKGHKPYTGQEPGRAADFTQGQSDGAELCEQAIRARGTK